MDITKYSQKLVNIIKEANQLAIRRNNVEVSDLHIFYSMLEIDEKRLRSYFNELGVFFQDIKDGFDKAIDKLRSAKGISSLYTSRSYQRALLISEEISRNQFEEKIKTDHMMLALLRQEDMPSAKLASSFGLTYQNFNKLVAKKFNEFLLEGIDQETIIRLEKYGTVLTKLAVEGKLDPVIGRDSETRDAIRVLSRRIKNNPVLIGEAGVGKTAIVEGIVQRIAKGDVPDNLKGKIVFSMDMAALVAGAKFRGDYEQRLKKIIDLIRESKGKIILFIDEIHNIMGQTSSSGAMDTANILKPMLARGEILTIGATTIEEYRKYIEKDKALDRRFQKILIEEPDINSSISILRGLKSKYESHHLVRITDPAITEAVRLSKRFLTERKLPDVAIDVIDEAAALVKIARDQRPEELDNLHRQIIKLSMENIALKEESDSLSALRQEQIEEEIKKLKHSLKEKSSLYEKEKQRQADILNLEREISINNLELEQAKSKANLNLLDKLSKSKKELENKLDKLNRKKPYYPLKTMVTTDEVKEIISKFSSMPKNKLESDKLKGIEMIRENLKKDFLGADDIIDKIINSYVIAEAGIFNKQKPALSMMLKGVTGSGKTYLAQLLAKYLYDGEKSYLSFDMSEFSEKSSITKLIGAPPGYVGYEQGGLLTETLRTKPYSVVVFENVSNAHNEVQNLINQILQSASIKDNKGRSINITNTIIVLTMGEDDDRKIINDLYKYVDFEFKLNKLDGKATRNLIKLKFNRLKEGLIDRQIKLDFEDGFLNRFSAYVEENQLDARDIKRIIEQDIYFLICKKALLDKSDDFIEMTISFDDHNDFKID